MNDKNLPPIRQQIVAQLQENLERFSRVRRGAAGTVSTGCAELDRCLPRGGLGRGTLVEWLSPRAGSGAESLALTAAREACREGGHWWSSIEQKVFIRRPRRAPGSIWHG